MKPLLPATVMGLTIFVMPESASAFNASFSWDGIPACEKISPEFKLSAVPAGTRLLRFAMQDLNVPGFRHGGSAVAYHGDTVKKGAISYIGPCPPAGEHHRYRWTIDALDAGGKMIGQTTVTQTFSP
jgi:phosphatidylethanolamine-binding protein (PEBP) family uncharacterized protein